MFVKNLAVAALAAFLSGGSIAAQQTATSATTTQATTTEMPTAIPDGGMPTYPKVETPEQRRLRLGMPEDPGTNPDPNKHYWRFGRSYHIEKFDKHWAVFDQGDPAFVRPFAPLNVVKELYQENEKWVWVWMPDYKPEDLIEEKPASGLTAEQIKMFKELSTEFKALDVPSSGKTIRFEESSEGLPRGGSYRNSLAVADINEDGCPDIITPPQRGGNGIPEIYLGDCKGHWKGMSSATWPYTMDYGSVVAADFNKDGHVDLAFGVHLNGVRVMLGDGKGHFVDASEGIKNDFPTRRVVVADVDHDGYPDIVALSEGASGTATGNVGGAKLRVYLNKNKGKSWEPVSLSAQQAVLGGDWLSVGKFNDDVYPDFVASSTYFNGSDILWASTEKKTWRNLGSGTTLIPWISYYFANVVGHFSSRKLDDAVISYVRQWPATLDARDVVPPAVNNVSGIDRISFSKNGATRLPIVRWTSSRPIWGMAAADIDGDGKLDLIYLQPNPRSIEILLGDGKGNFRSAAVEGITLPPNNTYDIKVADVNGDGRPDIILMYESAELTAFAPRNGSIHVYLNRGVSEAPKQAKK